MIEHTTHDDGYACLVELDEGVRIMGSMRSGTRPDAGLRVQLKGATMRDGKCHFEFNIA